MSTTETIQLKIDNLPENAKTGLRLPGIVNNLVAAPILCDAGCEVKFTKKKVTVTKNKKLLLEGWRDPKNNLWRVPLVQHEDPNEEKITKIIMIFYKKKKTTMTMLKSIMERLGKGMLSHKSTRKNQLRHKMPSPTAFWSTASTIAKMKNNW